MARSDRDPLIDAYFDALDEEDVEIARPAIAESFVYESSAGRLAGFEGFREYAEELRTTSNSTHEVVNRVHGDSISIAEGMVTGYGPDGQEKRGNFCDVFEFIEDDSALSRVTVYLNRALSD